MIIIRKKGSLLRYRSINQIFFALCLFAIGTLLLLVNIGVISLEIKELFVVSYPFVLFAFSIGKLIYAITIRKGWFGYLILTFFSSLLIVDRFNIINFQFWDFWKLWPILLIFIGVNLLLNKGRVKVHISSDVPLEKYQSKDKVIEQDEVGNQGTKVKIAQKFRGFSIGDVNFKSSNWAVEPMELYNTIGDYFIDFSKAFIPEKETPIRLQGVIGDVNILIPDDIPVEIHTKVKVGDIRLFELDSEGELSANREIYYKSPDYDDATRKLRMEISLKIGSIRIDRV
ncbi:cell wall-active antibiotics response protein LiaF [Cytobacillus spongiae]|uniref:cell wall-active antibiotics response protein LiaF n=1 Tax=Cytobacillus spongiae TaxID=2901381 RepID=UPI003D79DE0C